MDDNTQKTALTETSKAEVKKVIAKRPAVAKKKLTPKPKVANPVTVRKTVKNPSALKKVEKKQAKQKVIRDSFTMPEKEYRVLSEIKKKCLAGGIDVKKSELLRAGLQSLAGMSQAMLKKQLSKLAEIKIGRPAKPSKGK